MNGNRRIPTKDPFLLQYQPFELKFASEFLTAWLPFLSKDLCHRCTQRLSDKIGSLYLESDVRGESTNTDENTDSSSSTLDNLESSQQVINKSLPTWKDVAAGSSKSVADSSKCECASDVKSQSGARLSWADMAHEEEEEDRDPNKRVETVQKPTLPTEQSERIGFMSVKRKKDFRCYERIKGKPVNILEGLELHTGVFSVEEQKKIVDYTYDLQKKAMKGELKERTYTAPNKWMRGKGRVTIQFGCCYNYATDKKGNPPGILRDESVDPIPSLLKMMIKRMVRWHVLPSTCVPDSCIVNIYDEDDCIPPHIDNHDFVRPFCTVSFLSECNIVFGTNLKVMGPGDFAGSVAIPLPVGSVLVLNGNGADVAKHCIPAVPTKRISITFRKMDDAKRPIGFTPEPDLQGIQPLPYQPDQQKRLTSPIAEPHTPLPAQRNYGIEGRPYGSYSDPQFEHHHSNQSRRGGRFYSHRGSKWN